MNINKAQAEALLDLMEHYESTCAYGDAQGSHDAISNVLLAFGLIQDSQAYQDECGSMQFCPPSRAYQRAAAHFARLIQE